MVSPARFERAAYGLGIRCSILLSYGDILVIHSRFRLYVQPRIHDLQCIPVRQSRARDHDADDAPEH